MAPRASVKKVAAVEKGLRTPAFIGAVLVVGALAIGGAIFLGKSDSGEIDVTAAIQNSNQANANAGGDASGNVETVPETFKNMTNGGLVPQENQPEPAAVVTTEEVSATSTEEVASTTPEALDEQNQESAETSTETQQ